MLMQILVSLVDHLADDAYRRRRCSTAAPLPWPAPSGQSRLRCSSSPPSSGSRASRSALWSASLRSPSTTRREPTKAAWILLGSLCGIIALINPALMFSLLAIMGWLAFQTRRVSRTAPLIGLLALAAGLCSVAHSQRRPVSCIHPTAQHRRASRCGWATGPAPLAAWTNRIFPMFNQQELASYLAAGRGRLHARQVR